MILGRIHQPVAGQSSRVKNVRFGEASTPFKWPIREYGSFGQCVLPMPLKLISRFSFADFFLVFGAGKRR